MAPMALVACSDDGDGSSVGTTTESLADVSSDDGSGAPEVSICDDLELFPVLARTPSGVTSLMFQASSGILTLRLGYGSPDEDLDEEPWIALAVDVGTGHSSGAPTTVMTADGSFPGSFDARQVDQPGIDDPREASFAYWTAEGLAITASALDVSRAAFDEAIAELRLVDRASFLDYQEQAELRSEVLCT